jgi:hypothetical protein
MSGVRSKQGKVSEENRREAAALKSLWEASAEERKARGVSSQAAFGAEYDIGNQGAVWQYLNGKTALSLKAAMGFARGLRCRVADFSPRLAEEARTIAAVTDDGARNHGVASLHAREPARSYGESNDSTKVEAVAQSMSHPTPIVIPTITREMAMRDPENLPPIFSLALWDDALGPTLRAGTEVVWSKVKEPRVGSPVLVCDIEGQLFARFLGEGAKPGTFSAVPHAQKSQTFRALDSEANGLHVVASYAGRLGDFEDF